jgi:hypothetical protein
MRLPTVSRTPWRPAHLDRSLQRRDYKVVTLGARVEGGSGNASLETDNDEQQGGTKEDDSEDDHSGPEGNSQKYSRPRKARLPNSFLWKVEKSAVQKAREAMIYPIPSPLLRLSITDGESQSRATPPPATSFLDRSSLASLLVPYSQETQVDPEPLIADFGCSVGRDLAAGNPNSTVLCFTALQNFAQSTKKSSTPKHLVREPGKPSETLSSNRSSPRKNFFKVNAKNGFLGPDFAPLFKSCHLFSTSYYLNVTTLGSAKCESFLLLAGHMIRMSKTTILAVPMRCRQGFKQLATQLNQGDSTFDEEILGLVLSQRSSTQPLIELLGVKPQPFEATTNASGLAKGGPKPQPHDLLMAKSIDQHVVASSALLVRVTMVRHYRHRCNKIWERPRVGHRSSSFSYDRGEVTIEICQLRTNRFLRLIHPLSYIVSFSVDTLLSMGISAGTRQWLLGQMIQVPFYPDPFPHNWVIGGGGHVVRIDKQDSKFLQHRGARQYYWSRSTRGYHHLLATHLCLPVSMGFPAAEITDKCRPPCLVCAAKCPLRNVSETTPTACQACIQCGQCVSEEAMESDGAQREAKLQGADPHDTTATRSGSKVLTPQDVDSTSCMADTPYSGGIWTKGQAHWKKWEAFDKKHPISRLSSKPFQLQEM